VLAEATLVSRDRPGRGRSLRFRSEVGDLTLAVRLSLAGRRAEPVTVLVHDVTQPARAELELSRTRVALMENERLRLMGVLAAAVAHDLGTTLRAAGLYVEALRRDPASSAREEDLRQLGSVIESASDTVGKLHSFAKAKQVVTGAVNLGELLRDAISVVGMQVDKGRDIRFEARVADLPLVPGSGADISHLFVNLLLNAIEAMPAGGVVRIDARARRRGAVTIAITDDGMGIRPEHRDQLFLPFFTTKGAAGTGLGLWLAASTMKRMGGSIRCDTQVGKGTTFTLEFPSASGSQARAVSPREPARTGAGRRSAGRSRTASPAGRPPAAR
jgi:signal transduction histidine kinase